MEDHTLWGETSFFQSVHKSYVFPDLISVIIADRKPSPLYRYLTGVYALFIPD